jgi:hypothetical protein
VSKLAIRDTLRKRFPDRPWLDVLSKGDLLPSAPGDETRVSFCDGEKLRIGTLGISGGRSLTRPFRDARRFPSTRL